MMLSSVDSQALEVIKSDYPVLVMGERGLRSTNGSGRTDNELRILVFYLEKS
jgi:hypothetical protein